jgi:hypothetical protein
MSAELPQCRCHGEGFLITGVASQSTHLGTRFWERMPPVENNPASLPPQHEVRPANVTPIQPDSRNSFRDLTTLTNIVRVLIVLSIIGSGVAIYFSYLEVNFLDSVRSGLYESQEQMKADGRASDIRQGIIGITQFALLLSSGILFLVWTYRANRNAHCLSGTQMQFSPGWAVGWYFIPVLNVWKPYQALREIWQVSEGAAASSHESKSWFVLVYWVLRLATLAVDRISFKLSMRATTVDELRASSIADMASSLADILFAVAALTLIGAIFGMQMARRPADPYHVR